MGDLNLPSRSKTAWLKKASAILHSGETPTIQTRGEASLDFILVPKSMLINLKGTSAIGNSDHRSLVASIQFSKKLVRSTIET